MAAPKSAKELNTRLCELYDKIENQQIDVKLAHAMNSSAGKIIGLCNARLKQHALARTKPNIQFLKGE